MIDKSKLYYWGNAEACSVGSFGLLFDALILITELSVVNGELKINSKPADVILADYL